MRQKIVAGNWKMNTLLEEGAALAKNIADRINEVPSDVQLILAPPFTHLDRVGGIIKGTPAALSAQNCADKDKGAYTGEVSAAMLASAGCQYVILGHSERREYYHETSATLNEKIVLALANGLRPIFCVGEKLEEREAGRHFDVVGAQIREVLFNLSPEQLSQVVIAYEPVWAIGTGKSATPNVAQAVHSAIRQRVAQVNAEAAQTLPILYGGSVKPESAASLFAQADIDGGLVGGAALDPVSFHSIVMAADALR